jgi:uncharacterized protein
MNPLFFGSTGKALFGVYHPPRSRETRDHGIVLCYPAGQEYMRAHRAFRQLAILLSKAGFPVLRFDYFGTGDSNGESEQGSMEQWVEDVGTAIQELKDNAAVERVSLVGLRLGATLAARVQERRSDVASVVLWDPVVDGSSYFREIVATAESAGATVRLPDGRADPDATVGIYGYPWTGRLRRELDGVGLDAYRAPAKDRVAVLVSRERTDYLSLRDHYARQTDRLTYRCIPSPGDWAYIDAYGSALLPQDIIQGIVTHLTEESLS